MLENSLLCSVPVPEAAACAQAAQNRQQEGKSNLWKHQPHNYEQQSQGWSLQPRATATDKLSRVQGQSWTVLLHPELVAGEEGTGATDRGCGNRNRHLLSTTAAAELVTTGQTQADAQDYKRLLNPGLQNSSDLPLRPRGQQAYKYEFTSLKQWQS